ncbi:hypothetical protein niasHT_019856 [Heterodera trifolii]|uniref:Uncharacterized protein n=1 Tax=Heterodera trifolii TaxID=157864 RepID=A0ABD2KUY9_9BILA
MTLALPRGECRPQFALFAPHHHHHHNSNHAQKSLPDLTLRFLLIGLAVVAALLAVLALCLVCCWRRRKKQQRRVRPARLQKIPKITVEEAFSGLPDPSVKVKQLFCAMDAGTKNGGTNVAAGDEKHGNKFANDSPLPPMNGGGDYLDIGTPPFSNVVILNGQEEQQKVQQLRKNSGIFPENGLQKNGQQPQKWSLKDRPFTILINDDEIGNQKQLAHQKQLTASAASVGHANGHVLNERQSDPMPRVNPSPTSTKRFVTKMAKVTESANEQIYGEFEALNQPFLQTIRPRTTEAELPENIRKNRFYDILPFEFNRVRLRWASAYGGTDAKSDYINASLIRSKENGPIHCIAAQGPITETESADGRRVGTVRDFWEMIWQEGIDCIVMLEGGKQKFTEYWPESPGESAQITDDFSVHLYCVTDDEISQPSRIEALLDFIQTIRSSAKRSPFLVHCSTGSGRTGAYIALDLLLDKLHREQIIDVKAIVALLRAQRIAMVQTAEQYVTIYEAIALAIRRKSRSSG